MTPSIHTAETPESIDYFHIIHNAPATASGIKDLWIVHNDAWAKLEVQLGSLVGPNPDPNRDPPDERLLQAVGQAIAKIKEIVPKVQSSQGGW